MCLTIEWTPTNLLDGGETTIRTGDSLKLSAWPGGQPISGSITVTLDGQAIATNQESGQPIIYQFNTPGNYAINVTHFPLPMGEGQGQGAQHAQYTVHVLSATFGQAEPLLLHYRKSFAFPGLPADCHRSLENAPPMVTSKCTTLDGCFVIH
jgi:hypothetical protein